MKTILKALIVLAFLTLATRSKAQQVSKMIITDRFSGTTKVTMGKPKPAPAKTNFQLVSDEKGTQVMVYVDLVPDENLPDPYILKFFAYKIVNGKSEAVDDRELPTKKSATYALSAFNFFEEGSYKVIVTDQSGKQNLAEGGFTVTR